MRIHSKIKTKAKCLNKIEFDLSEIDLRKSKSTSIENRNRNFGITNGVMFMFSVFTSYELVDHIMVRHCRKVENGKRNLWSEKLRNGS